MPVDFYELLDVERDADKADIKQAFRQMAREYHPDVNDDDRATAQFTVVRKAYEVLTDETERADYDRMGHSTYVEKRLEGLRKFKFPGEAGRESNTSSSSSNTTSSSTSRSTGSSHTSSRSSRSSSGGRSSSSSRPSSGSSRKSSSSRTSSSRTSTSSSRTSSRSSHRSSNSSRSSRSRSSSSRKGSSRTSGSSTSSRRSSRRSNRRQNRSSTRDRNRFDGEPTQATTEDGTNPLWYGWTLSLVALLAYLSAVGWFIGTEGGAFVDALVGIDTAQPVPALLAPSVLSLPSLATLQTAAASAPLTLVLPAASVVLALALLTTVARFGHSWATWLYAVAALAPLALVVAGATGLARPLAVDAVALAVLPVLGAGGFVIDAGRYLWATR